ncbi:hypothetical protein BCR43DRAFT_499040 [Syncephalastrum racemosum]|uniref:Uncharacterized protein n=1 Tax=Syncephalastrum racemosum TaxID=13706 RepID=A0A1X2H233_SYNRA|nr:hypothetical protein BCR43DRAFT_499040 [Syncephalastrum racemosum]
MRKLIGVVLAFWLGYLTSSFGVFGFLLEDKRALYVVVGILSAYAAIFIPLERIAEAEAQRSAGYPYRTSAREQLQRRGSF